MQKGDISNAVLPRWLITLDALLDGKAVPKKRMWKTWDDVARSVVIPNGVLGALWAFTNRTHVQFELVVFDLPTEFSAAFESVLDMRGVHPIRWVTEYESREALRDNLAFRGDVQAVVDDHDHRFFWGVRGRSIREVASLG